METRTLVNQLIPVKTVLPEELVVPAGFEGRLRLPIRSRAELFALNNLVKDDQGEVFKYVVSICLTIPALD